MVEASKRLSTVERAFRSREDRGPPGPSAVHRPAERGRAHVLVFLLAHYVEWHMRKALAPLLFDDDDPAGARDSIVAPAQSSPGAADTAHSKRNAADDPVHRFRTLLGDLAAITRNTVKPRLAGKESVEVVTRPTPLQAKALAWLGGHP